MNQPQPTIRSGLRIPLLDGTNDQLVFSRHQWNLIITVCNAILASQNWVVTDHGVILDVGSVVGASGFFGVPIEADPTVAYEANKCVHIQASGFLATTGIRDAANPTGPLIKSKPGYYVSRQAVPKQSSVGGNPVWNLPQWPEPNGANKDDALNFWLYFGEVFC